MLMMIDFLCLCLSVCACVHVYVSMSAADVDEDQALSDSQANSQHEFDHSHFNNFRTITVPTTTTTTTQAATTTKTKNCRGLIQKRAHTLDDFMEGKRNIKKIQTNKYNLQYQASCYTVAATKKANLDSNRTHTAMSAKETNFF